MGADFYFAAIPTPVSVLGIRLRPYSLGHVLLLSRFDNAFVMGGRPALEDVIQGIVICSQTYAEALRDMDNPKLPSLVGKWQRSLQPRYWWGGRKPELGFSPAQAAKQFVEYLRAGSSFPIFSVPQDKKSNDPLHVPLVQTVKVYLMSKLNFSEAELLDRPWGLCLWDYFTSHAMEGNCKICDTTDDEALRAKLVELEHSLNNRLN